MKSGKLTPAMRRYLSTIRALDPSARGIRSIDVAKELGVTRSSVHSMLKRLSGMGYVSKEYYGIIYLSTEGIQAAENC